MLHPEVIVLFRCAPGVHCIAGVFHMRQFPIDLFVTGFAHHATVRHLGFLFFRTDLRFFLRPLCVFFRRLVLFFTFRRGDVITALCALQRVVGRVGSALLVGTTFGSDQQQDANCQQYYARYNQKRKQHILNRLRHCANAGVTDWDHRSGHERGFRRRHRRGRRRCRRRCWSIHGDLHFVALESLRIFQRVVRRYGKLVFA